LPRPTQANRHTVPGAGTIFALRAIGIVLFARWLFSMSQTGYAAVLTGIASSPFACLNLILLFLLIVLPGARARAERPFHPLPQWLRQSLRFLAAIGFVYATWSIGAFVWIAGPRPLLRAVVASNGWLAVAPVLYLAVAWICRPRALWRTHIAARRFAIGRHAIALDPAAGTAVVWIESRKVGLYDCRQLSLRFVHPDARARPVPLGLHPRAELRWNSPAAAGHNRGMVFRALLRNDADRVAARALEQALAQAGSAPAMLPA
jgi:hypothetical protein